MVKKLAVCPKCKKEMPEDNLYRRIEAEEIYVCKSCSEKHIKSVIAEIEIFRKSIDFHKAGELRKKLLWISEQMGHWHDNADKSSMEGIDYYDEYQFFELQGFVIDSEITLIDKLLRDDEDEFKQKHNPKLQKLRKELMNLLGKLGEFKK